MATESSSSPRTRVTNRKSISGSSTPTLVVNGDTERRPSIPRGLNTLTGSNSPRYNRKCGYIGRKLVLHFDVRNTILVADSVDNISVDQALNSFLTGVTWGQQGHHGWEWHSDRPSLGAPSPKSITYYKHLETQIVKVPSDRARLRRVTGDFTQEDIGRKFAPYFHKHLQYLEWPHEGAQGHNLTMAGRDGKLYHYILPSFYKLLHHLTKANRNFSVVIRTYGLDAPNVLKSIDLTVQGKHPQFPDKLPLEVSTVPGKIYRKCDNISMEVFGPSGTSQLRDERTIYNLLTDSEGISAFVDDFRYWQNNGYDHSCAKPLWIDPSERNVHHIFFDDNIRVTDKDSIVDVRVFDSASSGKARQLSQRDSAKFENMCLVQSDLLESTSNIDYFINKVATCERNYEHFLKSTNKR